MTKNSQKPFSKKAIQQIFELLEEAWPHAHCELRYHTPFQLLIAVVLSAQTTDKAVNKALEPLWHENPNFGPNDLIALGLEGFYERIKSIGLAPSKSKNCLGLAQKLLHDFKGEVPNTREELVSLPGVGQKTANVVLNVLYDLPYVAVDTHVERVIKRIGLVEGSASRTKIEHELEGMLPTALLKKVSLLLIFHGRYQCLARKPKCETCCIQSLCKKII
jgi:endonuclease-3